MEAFRGRGYMDYLAQAVKGPLQEPRFLDVLPGFVLDDERIPLIRDRLASVSTSAG